MQPNLQQIRDSLQEVLNKISSCLDFDDEIYSLIIKHKITLDLFKRELTNDFFFIKKIMNTDANGCKEYNSGMLSQIKDILGEENVSNYDICYHCERKFLINRNSPTNTMEHPICDECTLHIIKRCLNGDIVFCDS